jgi:hypothetical protein
MAADLVNGVRQVLQSRRLGSELCWLAIRSASDYRSDLRINLAMLIPKSVVDFRFRQPSVLMPSACLLLLLTQRSDTLGYLSESGTEFAADHVLEELL